MIDYPDSCMTEPEMLRKLIAEKIMPETGSIYAKYLDKSIEILKTEKRKKNRKIKINIADIGENLYFVICHIKGKRDNEKNGSFKMLVDTGATNSLMHTSVAEKFGIKYKPVKLRLQQQE